MQTAFLQVAYDTLYDFDDDKKIPVLTDLTSYDVYGFAIDRLSHERGSQPLSRLYRKSVSFDIESPYVEMATLKQHDVLRPLQRIDVAVSGSDNSWGYERLVFQENYENRLDIGGRWARNGDSKHGLTTIPYIVPRNFSDGELTLSALLTDPSEGTYDDSLVFPLVPNEPPKLDFTAFGTYFDGRRYEKMYTEPSRLDYGEFWSRSGEKFLVGVNLLDDVGIERYAIYRLLPDGSRVEPPLHERTWSSSCNGSRPKLSEIDRKEILFDQTEPTQYELSLNR